MSTISNVIDLYKDIVIQIATPYSTGTGFFIKKYDLIITNEHVVRDNKEVVIDGQKFEKQLTKVLFVDPKYDLAFLQTPQDHKMSEVYINNSSDLNEGDVVIAVGHPFGLKYTATKGIISNLMHQQGNVNYIQHDAALNPGNSGGPLIYLNGKIIGVNTFIIRDGNNIGFSLPVSYLEDSLKEFIQQKGESGVRCISCLNLVFESKAEDGYCPYCGSKINLISDLEVYEPVGVNKTIEQMLVELGYDINLSRRGPNNWEIFQGSAKVNVSYHQKTGLIVGDAYLATLPKKNIKPIYKFLLQRNYELESLTFSLRGQDIIISLLIYDQYLNVDSALEMFRHLFEKADEYDDILVNEFGAIWKKER